MTVSEFKAWFDGFTEGFQNRMPTKKQWERVKERIAEVDSDEKLVYRDYFRPWWPTWYTTTSDMIKITGGTNYSTNESHFTINADNDEDEHMNYMTIMCSAHDIGRNEALQLENEN